MSIDSRTAAEKAYYRNSQRPPWKEKPPIWLSAFKGVALVLVCLAVLYPFWNIIATSLASEHEITEHGGLIPFFPKAPTLAAYQTIFAGGTVTRAMLISIGITVIGTCLNVIFTASLAYALSRPIFAGRFILTTVLLTMLFGAGIIPNFLLINALGLYDSLAALIVPGLISAFNFLVMRNFFQSIPGELLDSARVDGAGDVSIFVRIVMPLSKAVTAVVALFYAVGHWNAYFNALLYLQDQNKWPLPLVLRLYVLQGQPVGATGSNVVTDAIPSIQAIQMAVVVVALVPILLVYPFLQRYFTKGVLTGAIKG
ncbi:carbohydrate ABC transporter permease [Microlunatus soli]|uniref:Carbohydrate ABC transporter membrane protein 2, CUT1 family n=1 Tax=Microlunatus soli TaxID=630515 RepID=A0A1H1WAK8_9ACTN|nr:carbohydrate ABC transporter permease [Microlunatus soli]SDS93711.1 carbohydrate ABC transporter membrane protein 2, CUT1 family [Microlunatus soli]